MKALTIATLLIAFAASAFGQSGEFALHVTSSEKLQPYLFKLTVTLDCPPNSDTQEKKYGPCQPGDGYIVLAVEHGISLVPGKTYQAYFPKGRGIHVLVNGKTAKLKMVGTVRDEKSATPPPTERGNDSEDADVQSAVAANADAEKQLKQTECVALASDKYEDDLTALVAAIKSCMGQPQ